MTVHSKSVGGISSEYPYGDTDLNRSHSYLLPRVLAILSSINVRHDLSIIDVGCGNGAVAANLANAGFTIQGIDGSSEGISRAKLAFPQLRFDRRSVYDNLAEEFGQFDVVLCLEVIEHLYAPRDFLVGVRKLLRPNGTLILSTPFHGYWKNLAIAIAGRFDEHFNSLTDHGHIKFWSFSTLGALMREAGLVVGQRQLVGRFPPLSKSMIFVAHPR